MVRRTLGMLTLLLCAAALCGSLSAQTEKTITIRMLDSRTGHLIATSDFLVRINHEETVHPNWVRQNEDGTGNILTSGVAAPNGCSKQTALAKPGEFVFFVRKQNLREQTQDYSSH